MLLEGKVALRDHEPIAAGFATAWKKAFRVEVRDGFLDVELVPVVENPSITGLEVEPMAAPGPRAKKAITATERGKGPPGSSKR